MRIKDPEHSAPRLAPRHARTPMDLSSPMPEQVAAWSTPRPSHWVLFVGAALRPDGAVAAELSRDGVRAVWRASTEQAVRTAQLATFDAVCMDTTSLGAATAGVIRRLRDVLPCPLLIVGSGLDPHEEIDALEQGADLFLTRPLPTRRLCAHLLALLRRSRTRPAEAPPRGERSDHAMAQMQALLLERLCSAVGRGHAYAEVDGALSVRASDVDEGVEVTIRGLHLRLR